MILILKYKNDPHYKFSVAYGATPWNSLITVSLWIASCLLWYYEYVTLAIVGLCLGSLMFVVCVINSAGDFLREKTVRQPAKLSRMLSRLDWLTPDHSEHVSPMSSASVSASCLNWSESGTLLDPKSGISASCCERINVLHGSEPLHVGVLALSNSRVFNSCDLTEDSVRQPLI
ncbi:uncharacterized protein LOC114828432 [Galendromus occidentalis]|uniref:Uncharacterized protein LOC114828432 n=1 Tax=Galendromus occidentalis TaxID=34638 RepID=A0AAJ7WIP7_9ACAR|nr:uncharacterized protein LOC114828432 [Galendromus occidentalis]